ncbi:hypothetical protein DSL72_003224 [Monilinia vaccinii-corymbosi]|uniref:DUF4470 domain-containing protein n=1 Tax=Monilinia vaccinii-corymbosi TaxID=61207 RepID=A0A8A3NWB9_9HELO|nr:hypothetical protein DSL72_003224 [Monilinia vaccinii-corymbosi]
MSAALGEEDPAIVEVVEKLTHEGNLLYRSGKLTQEDKANVAKLEHRLQRAIAHIPQASEKEKLQRRLKISASLPHIRASMHAFVAYFPVGNDHAASLYHDLFERFPRENDKTISFFLGGVGDARNLYATMIGLHQSERNGGAPRRKYRFVANDINRCALTRDLIIWTLLEELSTLEQDSDHRLMALATIFFIYESNIMPKYIHDNLRAIMEKILVSLNKGNSPLEWVSFHEYDTPKYIEVLKHWLGEGDEAFTTSEAMRGIQSAFPRQVPSYEQKCQKEQQLYAEYGLLYPPKKILLSREPELSNLLKNKLKPNKLREYVERNWRFNPTMMDLDWYKQMQRMGGLGGFDINTNPFDAVAHFYDYHTGHSPTSLFDHVAPLFNRAADALKKMKRRLHVEVICGDVVEIAEWFRFGISPTRVPRLKKLPTEFDIIHLSNIPFEARTLEASAWVPSSLMDKMIREGDENEDSVWYYGLFRTDTWERCWKIPGNVNHAEKGERWEDDVVSAADRQLVDLAGAALSLVNQESI